MFGLGWLLYRLVIVRIRGTTAAMSMLLTFGLALTIEGVLNITSGNYFRSATPSYFAESFHIGQIALPKAQVLEFLHPLDVSRLWGVGKVTAAKLREHGITKVGDVADLSESMLQSMLGRHLGRHLYSLAHNHD
ncbi:hypothetical protein ACFQ1S_45605, partial [Kibdelosporangium lantanae]